MIGSDAKLDCFTNCTIHCGVHKCQHPKDFNPDYYSICLGKCNMTFTELMASENCEKFNNTLTFLGILIIFIAIAVYSYYRSRRIAAETGVFKV
uniref:Uncharacterized protein n=1 Tax=Megaselia scalaris TaxID=36166 RepID=T1GS08_MEGSC